MIGATRWERIKELMGVVMDLPAERRAAFFEAHCSGDPGLREELESLIRAHDGAGEFLTLDPPDRVGPYRLVGLIGRGGMGYVYRAVRDDDHFKKVVAVKLVRHDIGGEPVLSRFRAERQILAELEHPGIARLLDGGATEDGRPFLVMEHVEGRRIDDYAAAQQLDTRARLELFRQVCSAVEYAHQKRVVHRDLKPANILVTGEGTPKLLDFGIAKLLDPADANQATATLLGPLTPDYASPEQLWGQPVGPASDVYSLGVILYELLTGQRPHRLSGGGPADLARLVQQEPERPSAAVAPTAAGLRHELEGDLDTIVLKALRRDPARRYPSSAALAEDLRRHLAGLPVQARPDSLSYRAGKFVRRHRTTLAWAALGAGLAGAVVAMIDRSRLDRGPAVPRTVFRTVPFTSSAGREDHPAFSPDGKLLAYDRSIEGQYADIYVQALGGGAPVRLTSKADLECCPVFSRDGSRIAFLQLNRSGVDVVSMPVTGGSERTVTRLEYGDPTGLDWSPDGELVVVQPRVQGHGIFAVSPDGGRQRQLTSTPEGAFDRQPRISPDGRRLAFLRRFGQVGTGVFIQTLKEPGAPRPLVPGEWQVWDLAWAADGRSLLFASERAGQEGLYGVALEGGPPWALPLVGGSGRSIPAVSRQGDRLAYSVHSSDMNVWRVEARAGAPSPHPWIQSTRHDNGPAFSPDGQRVAFLSDRSGNTQIWVCEADGRNPVQVTSFVGHSFSIPRWSPDGRRLAFDAGPLRGAKNVFVLELEGGSQPRALVDGPADDTMPSWSADGKWIYFDSHPMGSWRGWESWRVWKVPAAGGTPVPVTQPGSLVGLESPDGRFLYFMGMRPQKGLWRVPVDGGAETRVEKAAPVSRSSWAPAVDGLYLVTGQGEPPRHFIEFLHLGTGQSTRIAALDRPFADFGLTVSPDGKWLLYTQTDRRESDIMLVENFR